MYILSIKQTNLKEDVFFADEPNNAISAKKFNNLLYEQHKELFDSYQIQVSREIDKNGHFVFHRQVGYFKTAQNARDYFNIHTNSAHEIRQSMRTWNQDRNILSSAEIVDLDNNSKTLLLDCLQKVCERFGGQCSTSGCSTVHFVERFKSLQSF
jgi:hypothetical protein